jgi:hypothetical protein
MYGLGNSVVTVSSSQTGTFYVIYRYSTFHSEIALPISLKPLKERYDLTTEAIDTSRRYCGGGVLIDLGCRIPDRCSFLLSRFQPSPDRPPLLGSGALLSNSA